MKNLLLYTCHRQLDEIEYSSFFFNKSKFLTENFDVFIHCNNQNRTINDIKSRAKFNTKVDMVVTTKNSGYSCGHLEATSDLFEMFKKYNTVIHAHPDCYFINTDKLENSYSNEFDVMVSPCFYMGRIVYNTDFFCFKPKINFLSSWQENWEKNPNSIPEQFLFDTLKNQNLSTIEIDRYPNLNGAGFRDVDHFGLWHEHDNNKVKKAIDEKI
jgi:hypothetical protein